MEKVAKYLKKSYTEEFDKLMLKEIKTTPIQKVTIRHLTAWSDTASTSKTPELFKIKKIYDSWVKATIQELSKLGLEKINVFKRPDSNNSYFHFYLKADYLNNFFHFAIDAESALLSEKISFEATYEPKSEQYNRMPLAKKSTKDPSITTPPNLAKYIKKLLTKIP